MRLMETVEVCDLLGISKSTLYRWCDLSDSALDSVLAGAPGNHQLEKLREAGRGAVTARNYGSGLSQLMEKAAGRSETPTDFPKPFRIGRAFKWKDDEIMAWLETRRA